MHRVSLLTCLRVGAGLAARPRRLLSSRVVLRGGGTSGGGSSTLELLREEQIQETVEMLEYDRETPNVEKRFPRRMGRPGALKYGALPTPRSRPAQAALEHFERPQL